MQGVDGGLQSKVRGFACEVSDQNSIRNQYRTKGSSLECMPISDIGPAKIMSQLCHSCGIWWANSTSISAVPAYASASSKADRGTSIFAFTVLPSPSCSPQIWCRGSWKIQPLIYFTPQYFCVRLMGPTRLLRFLLPLFSPCYYLRMLVARCPGPD